jgi:hypothetical protein
VPEPISVSSQSGQTAVVYNRPRQTETHFELLLTRRKTADIGLYGRIQSCVKRNEIGLKMNVFRRDKSALNTQTKLGCKSWMNTFNRWKNWDS